MLPNYITQETARRLPEDRARKLAKSLGIDADRQLPTLEHPFVGDLPYNGQIDFELVITGCGSSTSLPCRLSYTADLVEPGSDYVIAGERLGAIQSTLHYAAWERDQPVPQWHSVAEDILPPAVDDWLRDQIEGQCLVQERLQEPS